MSRSPLVRSYSREARGIGGRQMRSGAWSQKGLLSGSSLKSADCAIRPFNNGIQRPPLSRTHNFYSPITARDCTQRTICQQYARTTVLRRGPKGPADGADRNQFSRYLASRWVTRFQSLRQLSGAHERSRMGRRLAYRGTCSSPIDRIPGKIDDRVVVTDRPDVGTRKADGKLALQWRCPTPHLISVELQIKICRHHHDVTYCHPARSSQHKYDDVCHLAGL